MQVITQAYCGPTSSRQEPRSRREQGMNDRNVRPEITGRRTAQMPVHELVSRACGSVIVWRVTGALASQRDTEVKGRANADL